MKRLLFLTCLTLLTGSFIQAYNPAHLKQFAETGFCRSCDLSGAQLTEIIAALRAKNQTIDLNSSNLFGANLEKANLEKAKMREAILSYANLREANCKDADLEKAKLVNTDLIGVNCKNANLKKATIFFSDARFANFSRANLTKTMLSFLDLTSANLKNADLTNSTLGATNFKSALLLGLKLSFLYPDIVKRKHWSTITLRSKRMETTSKNCKRRILITKSHRKKHAC